METAELQERQHAWRWPLDAMACSSGRCCLQLEWDPQLIRYFGGLGVLGVGGGGNPDDHGAIEHELGLFFPKCMELPGSSEPPLDDVMEWSGEQLEELIRNFPILDEDLVGFDPSCFLEDTSTAADASFLCKNSNAGVDGLLAPSSATPVEPPTLPVAQPEQPPLSSTTSNRHGDQQRQITSANCSSKRSTPQEKQDGGSGKRRRKSGLTVVRPFSVVKPGPRGVDGVETLADINERILTPSARPVRHPVGEFACAPRASAGGDRPAPSGKAVTGFTRLHTARKGTITVIRSSG
ncbi:uncharacterized protein LOC119305273 isoform X2 [Triticum dicoccoides]|uniref:Uncharacterized protein n=1 Tax=Triticum turgidum subsp. durum TaxID=4567 RepID=A0A9R0V600_TRITD|nr:uncharacterized protein LOC119305273 isoform X2 [Triticum dicoccoides]XP_044368678.1 uncharacterized protein LOC123091277 isoform X2 [Triticum aestivum]VAH16991.1 unnamed protein product [Triticum turgidum subsp. durum]